MGEKLRRRAIDYLSDKGWKPGNKLGLHSVIELMEQFAGFEIDKAARTAAKLLDGYDTGDDGFAVEAAIREQQR
jgi:hypothetical protein